MYDAKQYRRRTFHARELQAPGNLWHCGMLLLQQCIASGDNPCEKESERLNDKHAFPMLRANMFFRANEHVHVMHRLSGPCLVNLRRF